MTDIPDGYGVIAGRSTENAQHALAAAEAAGVSTSEVVAVNEGYLVPQAVLDQFHATGEADSDPWSASPGGGSGENVAEPPADTIPLEVDFGTPVEEGHAGPPDEVEATELDAGSTVEGSAAAPEEDAPLEGAPTSSWKNADIEAWADDHGVDLGGATTKADMLAAISDADTKEE